jgi:hypothetical protein
VHRGGEVLSESQSEAGMVLRARLAPAERSKVEPFVRSSDESAGVDATDVGAVQ